MGDIDTAAADSLKTLDPKRPIREADIVPDQHNRGVGLIGLVRNYHHSAALFAPNSKFTLALGVPRFQIFCCDNAQ